MPEQYRIVDVARINIGPVECWQVRQERPDRQHHLTVFPTAALEWRAAEYDIDHTAPDGIDLIIDMLLHEPFLPDDLEQTAVVAARDAGETEPVTLHSAPDRATARAAHLARIAHTKHTRVVVITTSAPADERRSTAASAPDPLDAIRADHGITPEGVAEKSDLVEQVRQQAARQHRQAPRGASPARPRSRTLNTTAWDPALLRRAQALQHDSGTETV